jgi:hypothetical protein
MWTNLDHNGGYNSERVLGVIGYMIYQTTIALAEHVENYAETMLLTSINSIKTPRPIGMSIISKASCLQSL